MSTRPVGRPPGRKVPHKPVVSARVPEVIYEQLKSDAQNNGRTIGQEMAWKIDRSFLVDWREEGRSKRFADLAQKTTHDERVQWICDVLLDKSIATEVFMNVLRMYDDMQRVLRNRDRRSSSA